MKKNILDMPEQTAKIHGDKIAFTDEEREVTYNEFLKNAKAIGSFLTCMGTTNKPVAVLAERSVLCLEGMFGVLYSGNFYVVLDCDMPKDRIDKILNKLSPAAILCADSLLEKARTLDFSGKIFSAESAAGTVIDEKKLAEVRSKQIDTDPAYALFTSGSTGTPKGAVVCHRSVIDYAHWVTTTFNINDETVFGSQTPFYFSMSVLDIFSTVNSGATFHIIAKKHFSFPVNLIKYMNEKKVNTIYWVPSALSIVANSKVLDVMKLDSIKKILFAGEVMPVKQLNVWRRHYPGAYYANLYGPTEVTDICTYFEVTQDLPDDSVLPIGKACNNCDVLVLNEKDELAAPGQEGELCVRGSFLAMGYYDDAEKTAASFVQNPLNTHYPELIYRTGDLVKYNESGELLYISRKDFQIKRMGYRIELGEIEAAAGSVTGVQACACIYAARGDKIVIAYEGRKVSEDDIFAASKTKLPAYMHPDRVIKLKKMPYNENGKINRKKLLSEI